LLFTKLFGQEWIPIRFYEGAAYSSLKWESIEGLTETMYDQIGRTHVGVSRYFPDKWPYRPLTFTKSVPFYGTGENRELNLPAGSAAYTFDDYHMVVRRNKDANLAAAIQFASQLPVDQGTWSVTIDGNDLLCKYLPSYDWTHKDSVAGNTANEAKAIALNRGQQLIPNLIEGGVAVEKRMACTVNMAYSAPTTPIVKTLNEEEQAAMIDSRREAYESILHQVSGSQVNSLRTVLELKDAPGTVKSVGAFLKTVAAVCSMLKKSSAKAGGLPSAASLTIAQLAAVHLWYQFGVKPSVKDVQTYLTLIGKSPLGVITPDDDAILTTGQSVRAAYSIDNRVGSTRLDNRVERQQLTYTGSWILDGEDESIALTQFAINNGGMSEPTPSIPNGGWWHHSGTLFGRALKPGWRQMPDWFVELVDQANGGSFEDIVIGRPTKGDIAMYFNPPVQTAWKLLALSWLADWAWNASNVLLRIERATRKVYCELEESWVTDTWEYRPIRWSVCPVVGTPLLTQGNSELVVVPFWQGSPLYNIQGQYLPVIRIQNGAVTKPRVTATQAVSFNYLAQTPPTSIWRAVSRYQIPLPPVRIPSMFEGELDAWRIGILCALSIVNLKSMSLALKQVNWSVAKCCGMWKQDRGVNYHLLYLAVAGVIAAKEFTHE
jgi:hypothetical protein